jgi:hypothetical protein
LVQILQQLALIARIAPTSAMMAMQAILRQRSPIRKILLHSREVFLRRRQVSRT